MQWDQIHQDSEDSIQVRGAKITLKSIVQHFKADVTSKPPKFFERIVLPFQQDHLWRGNNINYHSAAKLGNRCNFKNEKKNLHQKKV